ncbi:TylF/MycF/NovP-related O-methyltransferase [Paraburkholderia megapolitana]|uniref:O-methyltransferase/8-demethyl-8-(2,3-dimethoxy-alpha-L-rhamnosyl)tetracenomycin-C 4'-O-methyltransferase n=1 Tax=Paraburkholderia megapolitana TaxID=420953 RepID=A0A1I3WCE7_9BURK|nr:TylF/MycF/NovP-related O-methyltransferase [Paraburkholderia megapolitana]QDQ82220.1 macrocin-O-methyltransferase [Paraburkholderia megapolitana]SFK04447.1 O-methyltransferase/8-demethyl-8-(2,3-dimethoxy-alpha-L-rhamnosyl)tetracenomycin-C 4'-O-methyltransferase [Paraburkholderia megapolitana]
MSPASYNSDYVWLLKKILTNSIYEPDMPAATREEISRCAQILERVQAETPHVLAIYPYLTPGSLAEIFVRARRSRNVHTYVPMNGLDNVEQCLLRIAADKVDGDVVDAGTLRGGMAILMRGILKALGDTSRRVVVADSFEGLPPPGIKDSIMDNEIWYRFKDEAPEFYLDCKCSLEDVQDNFRAYDLLDDQTIFLKGWFNDTLPSFKTSAISLIRLDVDWYQSCLDVLENMYPLLSPGGYVIVDDYRLQGCRAAIDEFRTRCSVRSPLEVADEGSGVVYWRKLN